MTTDLPEKREVLLRRGIANNGTVTYSMAESLFSTGTYASKVLESMHQRGYLEKKEAHGYFKVVKAPEYIVEDFK